MTAKKMATGNIDIDQIIYKLLHGLKIKGYSIGTDAYIKTTQLFHWFLLEKKGNSIASFATYLAPVICKSDDEQTNFKKIFDEIFLSDFAEYENELRLEEEKQRKEEEEEIKRKKKKWGWIISLTALSLVFVFAVVWYFNQSAVPPIKTGNFFEQPFFVNRNNEISLSHAAIFNNPADSSKFDVAYKFHRSGNTQKGVTVRHSFRHYGKDTISVNLKSNSFAVDTTVIYPEVYVGPGKLFITPEKDLITSGDENMYTAGIDTLIHAGFHWEVIKTGDSSKNKKDIFTTNPLIYRFKDTGEYLISVKYNTSKDSILQKFPSEYTSASHIQTVLPQGLQLTAAYNPPSQVVTASVNKTWAVILSVLALLLLYVAIYIIRKKINPVKHTEDNFKGNKPPYDLQFTSKEENISAGYRLLRLSNDLKKRVESRTFSFDVSKTIRQSIINRGFITPGYIQKQTNREYLFLIDQAYTNSQQMKLFGYLARYFIDHQVKLDFYFYHQTPDIFYKELDGPKIILENIKDRYYNSALILFADGAGFIDYEAIKLKEKIAGGLAYWHNRVLVTPVPFDDWAKNEKILSTFFNLLPADVIGLMELIRALDTDTSEKLFVSQFNTYEAKYINFGSINALKEYLGNEELFQWVAALAVHPKIYWEITLEIGKSILKDQTKINYDILLKLARIRWITEGQFPPSTRLELLKNLTRNNEIKARESLLKMLDEMPADESLFFHEEKQLSSYTNSFILFSTGAKKYTEDKKIREGEEKFLALYGQKKIMDNPLKIYIEKKETVSDRWNTPVTTINGNEGIEAYIKEKEIIKRVISKSEKRKRNRSAAFFLTGVVSLLIILSCLFYNKDAIAKIEINKYLHLIDTTAGINNTIELNIATNNCFRQLMLSSKDSFATFEVSTEKGVLSTSKIKFSDSITTGMIYNGLSFDTAIKISYFLSFENGRSFEKEMPMSPGIYNLSLTGCGSLDSGEVLYYRGINEDTTAVFNVFDKSQYTINVSKPAVNANAVFSSDASNYVVFDSVIGKSEMYNLCMRLIAAGYPLKNIGINLSPNAQKNIVIKRVDSLNKWPVISSERLKCILFNEGCSGNRDSVRSAVQVFYSPGTVISKVRQLKTCINSNPVFNVSTAALSKGILYNQVWYYRDSYRDSVNLLLACLKTYFPNRPFSVHKKPAPSNSNISAEIYVYDTTVKPTLTVEMNISDERLRPGINSIRDALMKNGFLVSPVQVKKYISGNTITYNDSSLKNEAAVIQNIYEKYFTGIPIDVIYVADAAQRKVLTISLTQREPPTKGLLTISGLTFEKSIPEKNNFIISFSIACTLSNSSAATQLDGKICLSEALTNEQRIANTACTNFKFSKAGVSQLAEGINTSGLRPGRYSIHFTAAAPQKDTLLGYVNIEERAKPSQLCDTIHSYVGMGSDNVLFKGKRYINLPLKERGFNFSLIERNPKYASFTLEKDKCPPQKLSFNIGETKTIDLCDGAKISLTMLNWENATGKAKNKEAIFDAVICN
jgi:uncharacterized membrane protein (DUF485 family)